ncbi:MAG: ComF family protein [Phycisphaeraceae bacterium]|nr:ComF family protein [Phycisphaeraceae bacterium]
MPAKPPKFPWPPNPTDLTAPAEKLSEGAVHLLTHSADNLDLDVLTDEPSDEIAGDFDEDLASPSTPHGASRFFHALELQFLGRTSAPWHIRAAHWHPDEPGNYCPRCGITCRPFELDTLTDPASCVRCRDKRPAWDRFIRLGSYQGVLARSIRELKFSRFRALGESIGRVLGESIRKEVELREIHPRRVILIPMPMTPWRRLARGIDHSLVLTRGTRRSSGFPIQKLLARRHRPSQVSLPVSERRRNVSGAFFCRRSVLRIPPDAVLVVVDDVRTTGATMTEACRTLRAALKQRSTTPNSIQTDSRTQIWAATAGVAPLPGEGEAEKQG